MHFEYAGDDPKKNRMVSWFQAHCHAIATCLNAELPEASLVLIYSGFDTFGLLAAAPGTLDASGDSYKQWCEKYILPRIKSVEGDPVTAVDLWGARCGVLHTSTPLSKLEREGKAHQIWYQFADKVGVNFIMNSKLPPLGLDVQNLALAFKEGGIASITDINKDPLAFQAADARAQHFFRWGTVVFQARVPLVPRKVSGQQEGGRSQLDLAEPGAASPRGAARRYPKRSDYQAAGLVKVPCLSVSVVGNCAALRTPARICLMKSMCGSKARPGFGCGFRMPTLL